MTDPSTSRNQAAVRQEAIEALAHLNCDPRLLDRTRRATRVAALAAVDRRRRCRRNFAAIFAVLMTVVFLISPEIWTGVETVLLGDYSSSFSVEVSLCFLLFFPAMMAALVLVWKSQHGLRQDRHGS